MRKLFVILTILGTAVILITVFMSYKSNKTNKSEMVTTSFYPVYFFVSQIAGEKMKVINITPSGVEPHDYEPTARDIANIQNSKLLVIIGGVEPWAGDVQTKVLELNRDLGQLIEIDEDGESVKDPHIWLDPGLAQEMVRLIGDELIDLDPDNKDYYVSRMDNISARLSELDRDFESGLTECVRREIVTSHAAFGYLASAYGLKQVPITGLSPEAEPSLKELAELTNFVKENEVNYIFFETLVSPKLAQTLADEVGAETLVLDPIEGYLGRDYFEVMRDNLSNLRTALSCK